MNARDRGCRGPTCTRPIGWTHIHHLQWWRHDGPTSVDNGLALCHHCHHRIHDRGWTVTHDLATATATWTSPAGFVTTTTPTGRMPPSPRLHATDRAQHATGSTGALGPVGTAIPAATAVQANVGRTDTEPGDVHGTRSGDTGMLGTITHFDQPTPSPRPGKRP